MNFARIWCITNPTPAWRATPSWNVYMTKCNSGWEGYPVWQTGLPALTGHPTYHVNVIKLKWQIIWTRGLPHISGLTHPPGVPHLHVNRPWRQKKNSCHIGIWLTPEGIGVCVKWENCSSMKIRDRLYMQFKAVMGLITPLNAIIKDQILDITSMGLHGKWLLDYE